MGLTIIKEKGVDPQFFIDALVKTKLLFNDADVAAPFGIVIIRKNSIVSNKGTYNTIDMETALIFESITEEDECVVTMSSALENNAYNSQILIAPIMLDKYKESLSFNIMGDYFLTTSDDIPDYPGADYTTSLVRYTRKYIMNDDVCENFINCDFEKIIEDDIHDKIKIVYGTKDGMYIHNKDLFLTYRGILFSDLKIGNEIAGIFETNGELVIKNKISTNEYLCKRRLHVILKDFIFYHKADDIGEFRNREKFYVLEYKESRVLIISSKTNIVIEIWIHALHSYYNAYWIRRLHD